MPAEPEPPPDPWRQFSKLRPALHGLLYGLPAVCFPAAAGLLGGPGGVSALLMSLLVSWSTSQALAYLGYLRLGRTDAGQAQQLLRAGLRGRARDTRARHGEVPLWSGTRTSE